MVLIDWWSFLGHVRNLDMNGLILSLDVPVPEMFSSIVFQDISTKLHPPDEVIRISWLLIYLQRYMFGDAGFRHTAGDTCMSKSRHPQIHRISGEGEIHRY